MTAVTANQVIRGRLEGAKKASIPVASGQTIYQGTIVYDVSGEGTGDDNGGSNQFFGIAIHQAAAGENVECYITGVFELVGSSYTQASVGIPVYGIDNFTTQASSSSATLVGQCVEYVSDTKLLVDIGRALN